MTRRSIHSIAISSFVASSVAVACDQGASEAEMRSASDASAGAPQSFGGAAGQAQQLGGAAGEPQEPVGGSAGESPSCAARAPDIGCPEQPPAETELCVPGAICAYRVECDLGCADRLMLCPAEGEAWRVPTVGRCAACPVATKPVRPWTGSHTLHFSAIDGDCGSFPQLDYDAGLGVLDTFSCEPVERAAEECLIREHVQCTLDAVALELELTLEPGSIGFWVGEASIQLSSPSSTCAGTYNVWAS